MEPVSRDRMVDTVAIARRKHPGAKLSFDALCTRYGIDNSHRTKHGALLDSELLAEVYIEMIGGRQAALGLAGPGQTSVEENEAAGAMMVGRPKPLAPRVTEAERQAHETMVARIGGKALWTRYL
jgi:DNA polymerase-3 subunit epsilon